VTARRELVAAIALCAVGATAVVIAAGRHWVDFPAEVCEDFGCAQIFARGTLQEAVRALGVASGAGVVGVLASRGRSRQLVGALLVVIGCAVVVAGIRARQHPETPSGVTVVQIAPTRFSSTSMIATDWPLVASAGGFAVLLAGALVAARGHRWHQLAPRYDGPQGSQAAAAPDGEAALWDAQSRGEDPT
jgi:uncharacterized membrane protein (TIGR02234 family)